MRSSGILVATLAFIFVASSALAQQQVRLKSGGVLLGAVSVEGAEATVQVGDSTMRVPLADISEIAAVPHAEEPQPQRLLRTALEAKILNGADKEVVGLLAEAARLAPEDPQVLFWYATSLLDAGYGQAAHEALEPHLAAVRKAYPGAADRLVARIEQRLKIDRLPVDLVERLDQLAEDPHAAQPNNGDREQMAYFAIFRAVDQHGEPVSMTQNSIQGGGNNERLESFAEGYNLFYFFNYPGNRLQPVKLIVNQSGLRPQEIDLSVTKSIFSSPQELKVHRYVEEDKRDVKIRVVGQADKPIAQYKQFRFFRNIPSTSVANVALAFPKSAIQRDIDGTGFVVSRNSDYTITACTWTHKKWPHTTPEGKTLLRCYVGRPGDEAIVEQTDEEIVQLVLEDLQKTMDITEDPEFTIVSRWKEAMPQYTVGHKERMKKLTTFMEEELPGVYLAGSSYAGSGLPACIEQGKLAAKRVLFHLEKVMETKLVAH